MNTAASGAPMYQLSPEIKEFRDVARRIVREELLPLEQEYLKHPEQAYGLQPMTNLRAVFPKQVLERLEKIARDTGLWYVMVPEHLGGMGLSMLAQVVIIEEFMYTAVPFPWVNVPNILYECKGGQVERFLKPAIEGEKDPLFRPDRTGRRFRSRGNDEDQRRVGRVSVGDQRNEDVDIGCRGSRPHPGAGGDRCRKTAKGRNHDVRRRT